MNNESELLKFPSCNNISGLSKIEKLSRDSSGYYKIIKSKLPNNFYRIAHSKHEPNCIFSSSILKGRKKKDELLVKESCL